MNYMTISLIAPIFLLLGAAYMHIDNLKKAHNKIEVLAGKTVQKEDFYKEITVAQGSNFVALAMAAWIMLFVAFSYLYFLIPGAMPFSYMMQMPEWSSTPLGFFIFGLIAASLAAIVIFVVLDKFPENKRHFKLTELYSFYDISKRMKGYIGFAILPLILSVVFSAYLGTIYPEHNQYFESFSFIFLIISMCILIWPIWEGRK